MTNRTSLFQNHLDAGAKMVDFSGWEMPINYGSQIEEHTQVRTAAGVFGENSSDQISFLVATKGGGGHRVNVHRSGPCHTRGTAAAAT